MKLAINRLFTALVLVAGFFASQSHAAIDVTINKSANDASPIAIVPFVNDSSKTFDFDPADLIGSDLQKTAQFRIIARNALPGRPKLGEVNNLPSFAQSGANHVLVGRIHHAGSEDLVVDIELYDSNLNTRVLGQSFRTTAANMRRTTHYIADEIYQKITGVRGAFNTQIAYISVVRYSAKKAEYKLVIADSDGYNPQAVITSKYPLLSPTWSPDGRELAYVSLRNQHAEIYTLNLNTGKEQKLAGFAGINGAPAYSPDGKNLVATLSKSDTPKLYIYNFASKKWSQLTTGAAIDTEPVFSADGRFVYFTSDRSGGAQVYKIPVTGGDARRLVFNGRYNAAANASGDGRYVAMVHRDGSGYNIGVYDLQDDVFNTIGQGPQDESPSFAPNGKMVLYAGQDRGRQVLVVSSTDGRFSQTLVSLGEDIREPAWSPYLRTASK